jgi:alpha-acetolactate decarboxylase
MLNKYFKKVSNNEHDLAHLDNTVLSRDIQIQGYHEDILRKDRNCFGGGVLVYISEALKVKRREDLEFENSEMIFRKSYIAIS